MDLQEAVHRVDVTVKDFYGRSETAPITITTYRPAGPGPFPLLIFNHGRSPVEQRASMGRWRPEHAARYFVNKGFVVAAPTRVGNGEAMVGNFDPEFSGPCTPKRWQTVVQAVGEQVMATFEFMKQQPWVDATRWVVAGQSMGGTTALATAARRPLGLQAVINFAGGGGGDPVTRRHDPCDPGALERLWREQAQHAGKVPNLWIYWTHDRYWGEEHPKRWAQAWRDGGGELQFHHLPPWNSDTQVDGHTGMLRDMDHWVPVVEAFLAGVGHKLPGGVNLPPATGFARVDEVDKVPVDDRRRATAVQRFLAAKHPRALAVGPSGEAGWATGDWAIGRALGFCQARTGVACRLYAVDDTVVWVPF